MTATSDAKTAMQKTSENRKNEGNMAPPEAPNNLPVTEAKVLEICSVPHEESKIAVLRRLNEL